MGPLEGCIVVSVQCVAGFVAHMRPVERVLSGSSARRQLNSGGMTFWVDRVTLITLANS